MELESYFLSPQPFLKFAPPPRNKKINMEKEKETHRTGILWMRLSCTASGQVQAGERVTKTRAPPPETQHPNLPLPCRQGPPPPRASYLRSHVAAGSEQTGCVTAPAEKRRCGEVCASSRRFLPAPHQIIRQSREWLSMGLEAQLGRVLPGTGRPSSSYLGTPQAGRLCSRPHKPGPQFHSFLFFM